MTDSVASRPRRRLLNIDFDDVTMDELLERREGTVITVHVDSMAKLQRDRAFYDAVKQFDVVTCDSQILFAAAKLLGVPLRERVSGSDLLPRLYARHADDPTFTIFLCGALGDIAEQARAKINAKVGREIVVGAFGPAAGWMEDPEQVQDVIDRVDASGATVLVYGLPAGSQERFLQANKDRFANVRLFLPLGGTIDYEAGAVKRPPPRVTDMGLEWAWRLIREPRRRWRRYLLHQPPVLLHLLRQRLGIYRDPFAA